MNISPCPNPECGYDKIDTSSMNNVIGDATCGLTWWAVCLKCHYQGPKADREEDAIRLHNNMHVPTHYGDKRGTYAAPDDAKQAGECACPQHGKWLAAEDIYRMVRELDVAMNGVNGAAKQASLCDIFEELKEYIEAAKADVVVAPDDGKGQPVAWTALKTILNQCSIHLRTDATAKELRDDLNIIQLHCLEALWIPSAPQGWLDAAAREEQPFAYAYRYDNFVGGTVIRFNHGEEVNGTKPFETIPLYTHPAPTSAPEGFVMVPRQLTAKMHEAVREYWLSLHNNSFVPIGEFNGIWHAALSAAEKGK